MPDATATASTVLRLNSVSMKIQSSKPPAPHAEGMHYSLQYDTGAVSHNGSRVGRIFIEEQACGDSVYISLLNRGNREKRFQ